MNRRGVTIFLFLICLYKLPALEIQITHKEAGSDFRLEANNSLGFGGDFSAFGDIELNDHFGAKAGFALGSLDREFEIKVFSSVCYTSLFDIPLNVTLLYNYDGLPGPSYNCHVHSLLPYVSYNGKWAGISVGANFRFTSFFGEPAIFESMLSFSGYVHFITSEKLLAGLRCANFSDFYIKNMGAYSLSLFYNIRITDQWSIANELEFMQAGSVGLSSDYYGFTYRGGVRFTW
jgi:hypothetical protein